MSVAPLVVVCDFEFCLCGLETMWAPRGYMYRSQHKSRTRVHLHLARSTALRTLKLTPLHTAPAPRRVTPHLAPGLSSQLTGRSGAAESVDRAPYDLALLSRAYSTARSSTGRNEQDKTNALQNERRRFRTSRIHEHEKTRPRGRECPCCARGIEGAGPRPACYGSREDCCVGGRIRLCGARARPRIRGDGAGAAANGAGGVPDVRGRGRRRGGAGGAAGATRGGRAAVVAQDSVCAAGCHAEGSQGALGGAASRGGATAPGGCVRRVAC